MNFFCEVSFLALFQLETNLKATLKTFSHHNCPDRISVANLIRPGKIDREPCHVAIVVSDLLAHRGGTILNNASEDTSLGNIAQL